MSNEARKPVDLLEMYRRYNANHANYVRRVGPPGHEYTSHASRSEQWAGATADATIDELADAEQEATMLHLSTQMVLIDRLVAVGHPRTRFGSNVFACTRCDWFFAPFHGDPAVHYAYGESELDDDWHCYVLEVPVKMSDAGGYTVAGMTDGCYLLLTTDRRREPLPWAEKYKEKK